MKYFTCKDYLEKMVQALIPNIQAHKQNKAAWEIRRFFGKLPKAIPSFWEMAHTQGGDDTWCYQRKCKTNAKGYHQRNTECKLFEL